MTLQTAKTIAKTNGCSLRHKDGEYRVNLIGGIEATAYYTNDRVDAVMTAIYMRRTIEQREEIALRDAKTALTNCTLRIASLMSFDPRNTDVNLTCARYANVMQIMNLRDYLHSSVYAGGR